MFGQCYVYNELNKYHVTGNRDVHQFWMKDVSGIDIDEVNLIYYNKTSGADCPDVKLYMNVKSGKSESGRKGRGSEYGW